MGSNSALLRRWIIGLNRSFPSLKFLSHDEWNFLVFETRERHIQKDWRVLQSKIFAL